MTDYKRMYLRLFNKITDALTQLGQQNYDTAAQILRSAQKQAEEIYLDSEQEQPES